MSPLSLFQGDGESITVIGPDGQSLADYSWGASTNHPYFSQVRPLSHSGVLTNHAPYDHRWHHGIWWAWKFINDVNFWEDHPLFGGSRAAGLGRARVVDHEVSDDSEASSVSIAELVEWIPNGTTDSLLTESRVMTLTNDSDAWFIDWNASFVANQDLVFAATPYPEVSWGGYGGLNYRPARSMRDGERILADGNRRGLKEVHGNAMEWAAYGGLVDGAGDDSPAEPACGSVAIFAHRDNAWPSKIYAATAQENFGFLAAAPLFSVERPLHAGALLELNFRIRVSDSLPSAAELEEEGAQHRTNHADRLAD